MTFKNRQWYRNLVSQMPKTVGQADLAALLLADCPLIDLRAPVEFLTGSVPSAINMPLLTDDERHQVGVAYKQLGKAAALALGHCLVGGAVRQARLDQWIARIEKHPATHLFCFRGGLRSQTVQAWLAEAGVHCPVVAGGYKAIRHFLINILERRVNELEFLVVGGPTGSRKTRYLQASNQPFIDLERLAMHRGSAFGAEESPQPTQINFENSLAVAMLKLMEAGVPILIENESQRIGRCSIPNPVFSKMQVSRKIILNVPFEERVQNIYQDYVVNSSLRLSGNAERFTEFRDSTIAISKKLGGQRTKEILNDLETSRQEFLRGQGLESNRVWIAKILTWYYDPLYQKSAQAAVTRSSARLDAAINAGIFDAGLDFLQNEGS